MRQRIDITKKHTAGAASREGIKPMSSTDNFSIKLYNSWHCSCASNGGMRHSSLPDAEKRVQARAQNLGVMPGFPAGLLLAFSHLDCHPKPDSRPAQFGPRRHPSDLAVCQAVPPTALLLTYKPLTLRLAVTHQCAFCRSDGTSAYTESFSRSLMASLCVHWSFWHVEQYRSFEPRSLAYSGCSGPDCCPRCNAHKAARSLHGTEWREIGCSRRCVLFAFVQSRECSCAEKTSVVERCLCKQ